MISDCHPKLTELVRRLVEAGFPIEETVNTQGENPSRRFDVQGNKSLGRIVLWNSGEWELETISEETGNLTFWKSLNQPEEANLSEILADWESSMLT